MAPGAVMETLHEATRRLEAAGYADVLSPRTDGTFELANGQRVAPESMEIDEVVRFEGETNPADEAVVFALRSEDGRTRGTFVATYGPAVDPACAAVIERLGEGDEHETRKRKEKTR
ncbi:MAG: hypothetical protein ACQGVC_10815 [Myxococcota bacterium]